MISRVNMDSIERTREANKYITTLKTGWLSPTGEFIEADYMQHSDVAEEICERYNDFRRFKTNAEDFIEKKGWVGIKMTLWQGRSWVISHDLHVGFTPEQRAFLEPYLHDTIKPDIGFRIDIEMYDEGEWT